jgi:ATP-dependent Clp protease ATP-binding subunit ClpC
MCARFAASEQSLGREHVAQVVADQVGVPLEVVVATDVQRDEAVARELRRLVVGQDHAVEAVERAVRRAFSPLRDPTRPLASLVFGGPSSVGKSYVARIIRRQLYASAPLIRLNMAEFSERHNVSRLFGAPPGYIGFGDRNQFTDRVRRHPHSVVVLDNLDKAHPDVLTAIMEMLDAGMLTDGEGNEVDFRGTFIIMTTTAGTTERAGGTVGFATTSRTEAANNPAGDRLISACRRLFGDEFVNRVDEFVPFAPLEPAALRDIAALAISEISRRLVPRGISLHCDAQVLDRLACASDNARVVRAAVRNGIEPLLCRVLTRTTGKRLRVSLKDDHYAVEPC